MPKAVFQQSELPPQNSNWTKRFTAHMWEKVLYYMDCRRPRDLIVHQCDEAYMCHRYVPDTGALELIEDGEFGESDIFDNMNLLSIRSALALMPRNEQWLTCSADEDEEEKYVKANQDYQMFLHRKARTRRQFQRHQKQKFVRGRSAIYWEWDEQIVWRRITRSENGRQLKKFLKQLGLSRKDATSYARGKYPHVIFNGPLIAPVDYYDLWVDPMADLVLNKRPSTVLRRFFQLERLKSEVDDFSEQKVYDIPDDLQPIPISELIESPDQAGGRLASQRLFGMLPIRGDEHVKLIPVYIIYMPYVEFEGLKFWDTYFHLAYGAGGKRYIIRVEENPSDLGLSHLLIDDCVDHFTPTAGGGISLVEKQLSKYFQKNLLQLLTITAAAHSIVPARNVLIDKFRYGVPSFLPGAVNYIDGENLNVMSAVDAGAQGTQLGEQLLRFYSDEMRAMSGVDGLVADNVSRTLQKEKTATEVNRDLTSGSMVLDNAAENDAEVLTDLCMAVFQTSQQRSVPNAEGIIEYEKYLGDRVINGRLPQEELQRPRSIQVTGQMGALNRQQELSSILQGLQIAGQVSQTLGPQVVPFIYSGFIKAWRKLGIPIPEGVSENPEQTLANNPQLQQAVMQQGAQNPNVLQLMQGGALNGNANAGGRQEKARRTAQRWNFSTTRNL